MGPFLALVAAGGFGLSTVVLRPVIQELGVFRMMFWNLLINIVVFGVVLGGLTFWTTVDMPPAAAVWRFALAGLSALFVGRTALYFSVSQIGASRASAFRVASPFFTAILGVMFLGEHVGAVQAAGIVVIGAGLLGIARESAAGNAEARHEVVADAAAGSNHPASSYAGVSTYGSLGTRPGFKADVAGFRLGTGTAGVVAGLFAALSFSLGDVWRKAGISIHPDPLVASGLSVFVGFALMSAMVSARRSRVSLMRVPRPIVHRLVGGSLGTAFALVMLNGAMQLIPVSVATPLAGTEALFALMFGRLLAPEGERVTSRLLVASMTVVAGAALLVGFRG